MVLLIVWILVSFGIVLLAIQPATDYDFSAPLGIALLFIIGMVFTIAWSIRGCTG